jgi:hypothetical protein
MKGHTPGPWTFDDDGKTLLGGNWRKILVMADLQHDADAALIMAAPDLLRACRHVLACINTLAPNLKTRPEVETCRRAIIKATSADE